MLNIDNIQSYEEGDSSGLSPSLIKLLEDSNFIQGAPSAAIASQTLQQLNQEVARQFGQKKYNLTDDGFRYVLLDTPTQVHLILRKYIEQVQQKNEKVVVELIKLIFNLALAEYEQTYKLRTKNDVVRRILTEDFEKMGLVEFTIQEKDKFYITKLM
jgi:hypothetical protein